MGATTPLGKPTALTQPNAGGLMPPSAALARYRALVVQLPVPRNLVFEYDQTRIGPSRVISERHRVYRNETGDERNETVLVNGTTIVPAIVRVFRRAAFPYDAARFLVDDERYSVKFIGLTVVAGRRVFAYDVASKTPVPADAPHFAVKRLYLDAVRLLPLRELFEVAANACEGGGMIDFAPAERYWVAVSVRATCSPSAAPPSPTAAQPVKPKTFRDSIRFFGYRFPAAIPPEVFARATASPSP